MVPIAASSRYLKLDKKAQRGKKNTRSQKSGVRSQKSEVRSQESEVRSQKSGVRSQESEYKISCQFLVVRRDNKRNFTGELPYIKAA